jgi:integrase
VGRFSLLVDEAVNPGGRSQNHTVLNKNFVSYSFNLVAKKANVQDFRFHDLRHTAATRMIQAGKDLYKVQRILGHKSPIHTQRYAHHYPESLRDAVEVLDSHITNLSQEGVGNR